VVHVGVGRPMKETWFWIDIEFQAHQNLSFRLNMLNLPHAKFTLGRIRNGIPMAMLIQFQLALSVLNCSPWALVKIISLIAWPSTCYYRRKPKLN
jgi:hypothetical protein